MQTRLWFTIAIFAVGLAGCQLVESILTPDPSPTPVAPQLTPAIPVPVPSRGANFIVRRDGFSFPNYTSDARPIDLTPANLERLCGRGTCERGHGNACVPSAAMRSFMTYANKSMAGGHCEGMSVLSQAIYDGHVPLSRFDGNVNATYNLPFNQNVQSEIAYWYATQLTYPAGHNALQTPKEVLKQLRNNTNSYSIGICMADLSGCHAVSPIKIVADMKNKEIQWIHIYDSNYPGDDRRYIQINASANQWRYEDYVGDAKTKTLFLRPFSKRIVQAKCSPRGNQEEDEEDEEEDSDWEVWLNGDGNLVVPAGTGWVARTSEGEHGVVPIYLFKPGQDIALSIEGKNLTGQQTSLAFFKNGQALALDGIKLEANENERVMVGKDGNSLVYSTSDKEEITVTLGATYQGADYEVKIQPVAKSTGFEISVVNQSEPRRGNHKLTFKMKSLDGSPSTFSLKLTRIGAKSDQEFTHHEGLSIESNETVTLEYGKWLKDKQPLSINRDLDSDGTVDQSQAISDDE